MDRPKQKRAWINEEVIDSPHCIFLLFLAFIQLSEDSISFVTKSLLSRSGKRAWSHFMSAFLSSTQESEIIFKEEF